jgi:hypothetical protein
MSELENEINRLNGMIAGLKHEVYRADQCAMFRTMLYTSYEGLWEDALQMGKRLRDEKMLDVSESKMMNAIMGLTMHNTVNWTSWGKQKSMVSELFDLLMETGGRLVLNLICPSGRTSLLRALKNGSIYVAELIASQPETAVDFYFSGDTQPNALFWAINLHNDRLCEILLSRPLDLDLDSVDYDGQTAWERLQNQIHHTAWNFPRKISDLFKSAQKTVDEYKFLAPILISTTLHPIFPKPIISIICSLLKLPPIHPALTHLS